jgi:hypothetical protein
VYAVKKVEEPLKNIKDNNLRRRKGNVSLIKRYLLFKRLTSQSIEQFRDININDFDLNIAEHIE